MSDYKMNICGKIRLSDYSSIHDYMGVIGPSDNFHIEMNDTTEEDARVLCNILESDKFNILERGGIQSGTYYIQAERRR
ncbi:MAG: hypothetical protein RR891_09840 [Clostridium sp.]|uniref:hypothetical protein n=1 Tax=Clostridium sp. TaxID=1506 RepID=UPI003056F090